MLRRVETVEGMEPGAFRQRPAFTELISIDRDLRLAKSSSDINFVLQHLKSRVIDATSAYDGAIALATQDDDKQYLAKAKDAFNGYIAAAHEIAALQREIVDLRDKQLAEAQGWSRPIRRRRWLLGASSAVGIRIAGIRPPHAW